MTVPFDPDNFDTKADCIEHLLFSLLRGEHLRSDDWDVTAGFSKEECRVMLGLPGDLSEPPCRARTSKLYEAAEQVYYLFVHREYPPAVRCRSCGTLDPDPRAEYSELSYDDELTCRECRTTDAVGYMRGLYPEESPRVRHKREMMRLVHSDN